MNTHETPRVGHILRLAEIIREVDGNHSLGAAALAEAILSHPQIGMVQLAPAGQSSELIKMRIRNLIASREFNTAEANRELTVLGNWRCDHAGFDRELLEEINDLLRQLTSNQSTPNQ